jgi:GT2 family glycosyltransferase
MAPPIRRDPLVFIVVLNWNGLTDTLECVRSLARLEYSNTHILVVDNGSRNEEAARIEAALPAVTVMRYSENLGYAGGNNCGIRFALGQGADYIWLLNNDTTVSSTCLTELISAGEQRPDVGLLSPVVYKHGSECEIRFSGAILDRRREEHQTLRAVDDMETASKKGPILLFGTALILKRKAVDAVGLLDERYFAYHEDVDYCLRVLAAGLRTLVVPKAKVYHKVGRSLGPESPIREYLLVRNQYLLRSSHLAGWQRRTYPRRYVAWTLGRVLDSRRSGRDVVADYALDGLWDALRGRWGSWETKGQLPKALRLFLLDYVLVWHPYFWIMLISGNLRNVFSEAARRLFRRTTT